ncbi:MAG: restriction endonuclease subunit S [Rhodospirillaceae bacterium]|nr:restriction endonuclease subunit S [Rhodospirillaceae bacterium]
MTLPTGWAQTSLGNLAEFVMGQAPPGVDCNKQGVGTPFVKAGEFGPERPVVREWTTKPLKFATAADVLICVVGATAGKLNLGADCAIGRSVAAIRPNDATSAAFLYPRLKSEVGKLRSGSTGTAQGVISREMLADIPIMLPPLAEQRRIVSKISATKDQISNCRNSIPKLSNLLKLLRTKALELGLQGLLTQQIRSEISNPIVPYPVLDDQERCGWNFQNLPHDWKWVSFSNFLRDVTENDRKIPERDYQMDGPFPIVDQGRSEVAGFTDREYLVHPSRHPCIVFGDHTRRIKLVSPPFVQGADGVRVLAPAPGVDIRFARYAMLGANIPNKGYSRHMKFIKRAVWPVPPIEEQVSIIARLDFAFDRIAHLEEEVTNALALLDRLEGAILDKAFRGELVPQDPDDEPASVMLERIRAARATEKPAPRRRASAAPAG